MKTHIVVLGMGEIGSALSSILEKKKHPVDSWDVISGKVHNQKTLFEIIPHADILFLCVPSWGLPQVMKSIQPFVHAQTLVVGLSKGLQREKSETTYDFLVRMLHPGQQVVLLAGAMLAEELQKGMPGIGVVAGKNKKACETICDLFKGSSLKLTSSTDVKGIAYAGALKNSYALGLGITEGINWGGNARAWFAYESFFEMEKIIKLLGGKKESFWGPAGIVDFIATGFSSYSKNAEWGRLFAAGKEALPQSEGSISLESIAKLLRGNMDAFPLFQTIVRVAAKKEDAEGAFRKLLK
ncbi:MAG: hypothetical protein WCV80_00845 [Candidatus Paceibacterota bacterium]|jgi:glycerol-3-phosphate dehydrogenase (NAD(P)+)